MRFALPLKALPEDVHERYQFLHAYFCDLQAHSFIQEGQWIVELFWPHTREYFADPHIEEGFNWWEPELALDKGYQQVRRMNGYQLSLHDSWTVHSWSNWLYKETKTKGFPKEVIILHVDYHNDLMSPRLIINNNQFHDLLTRAPFSIIEPESVKRTILSGAVGIGSFMVPFLHSVSKVYVRHLCDGDLSKRNAHFNSLKRILQLDTLLDIKQFRPAVTLQSNEHQNSTVNTVPYKITNQVDEWLKDLPDVAILLHIDMDYFNCRYDGDTDWQTNENRYDPDWFLMNEKMEQIFNGIAKRGLGRQIRDITVALSPGFYPVEFWKEGVEKISKLIQSMS